MWVKLIMILFKKDARVWCLIDGSLLVEKDLDLHELKSCYTKKYFITELDLQRVFLRWLELVRSRCYLKNFLVFFRM